MLTLTAKKNSYSLHSIESRDSLTFSAEAYSKFKYGSKTQADIFGVSMAKDFVKSERFKEIVEIGNQVVVVPSPYGYVISAATLIQKSFIRHLSEELVSVGMKPAQETKIARDKFYTVDYASMDHSRRRELIQADKFYIDKGYVSGKTLLHIDDIKITGAHQEVVERVISEHNLGNTTDNFFLYYAELINPEEDPKIENYLNEYHVRSLFDINKIIHEDEFVFNTRVMKYLLKSEQDDFIWFIDNQDTNFMEELYYLSIGEGYLGLPEFTDNLNILKQYL